MSDGPGSKAGGAAGFGAAEIDIDRVGQDPGRRVRCAPAAHLHSIGARLRNRDHAPPAHGFYESRAVPQDHQARVVEGGGSHRQHGRAAPRQGLPHRRAATRALGDQIDPAWPPHAVDHRVSAAGPKGFDERCCVRRRVCCRRLREHRVDRKRLERRDVRRNAGDAGPTALDGRPSDPAMRVERGECRHGPPRCGLVPPGQRRGRTIEHRREGGPRPDPIAEERLSQRGPGTATPRAVRVQPLDAVHARIPPVPAPARASANRGARRCRSRQGGGHRPRPPRASPPRRYGARGRPMRHVVPAVGADLDGVEAEHAVDVSGRSRLPRRVAVIGEDDELEAGAGGGRRNRRRAWPCRRIGCCGRAYAPATVRRRRSGSWVPDGAFSRRGQDERPRK